MPRLVSSPESEPVHSMTYPRVLVHKGQLPEVLDQAFTLNCIESTINNKTVSLILPYLNDHSLGLQW